MNTTDSIDAATEKSKDLSDKVKTITDKDEKAKATAEITKLTSFKATIDYAEPLAKALKTALDAKGIRPAFDCDCETIAPGQQIYGDIEYLFAVNFTPKDYLGANQSGVGIPVSAQRHPLAAERWTAYLQCGVRHPGVLHGKGPGDDRLAELRPRRNDGLRTHRASHRRHHGEHTGDQPRFHPRRESAAPRISPPRCWTRSTR